MKTVVTVLLAFVMLSGAALAQVPKPVTIYVGGGLTPLTGDFGDVWNMGFHGSGAVGINVAPGFQIAPKLEYHSFPLEKYGLPVSGGTLSVLMIGGDARYQFGLPEAKVKPMILGGLGMGKASVSDLSGGGETLDISASETKIYFEFGGGVLFTVSPSMKMFVTARYTSVATEGISLNYIPITVGLAF